MEPPIILAQYCLQKTYDSQQAPTPPMTNEKTTMRLCVWTSVKNRKRMTDANPLKGFSVWPSRLIPTGKYRYVVNHGDVCSTVTARLIHHRFQTFWRPSPALVKNSVENDPIRG